ncbi:patatin [Cylindrospermum sp. NIES-4074]|nr:patatin [Cylindrospermum sp. NIES-4074]
MTFKILSLDGGGIRGVITARILEEVEKKVQAIHGKKLNEYFDLIAGTSTGSILAAGLVIGKSASQLKNLYLTEGRTIFPKRSGFVDSLWDKVPLLPFRGPKYSHDGLIEVLKKNLHHDNFGDMKIGQIKEYHKISNSQANLLILAYDTLNRNTTFFLSKHDSSRGRWYDHTELWKICVCSASAPTFFPPYEIRWTDSRDETKTEYKFPHVDGGVAANNPSLAALIHVMQTEKQKLEDISILSIGTGRTTEPYEYRAVNSWKMLDWAQKIPNVFMGSQLQLFSDLCGQIITSDERTSYLRLQFDLNNIFGERKNNYSPRPLLTLTKEQKKLEQMDDASQENIDKLLEITRTYLNDGKKIDEGKEIKSGKTDSIEKFIKDNK